MITQTKRNAIRQRIHARIRAKLSGTGERPRLNVYRSLNNIYAQLIDDEKGVTLVSASTIKLKTGGNVAAAREIGKTVAELAVQKGIKKVVFDRGGFLYHGRIKALADAAREAGLEF
jgi:large subunit ribosomal protein L18